MVAAAWSEVDADRGEPVGDSPRGMNAPSPLVAILPAKFEMIKNETGKIKWL